VHALLPGMQREVTHYCKQIGNLGERLVAQAFERRGFRVLGQQIYTRFGEIDLIVQNDSEVLFVEVKTRTSRAFGLPEESVGRAKLLHLRRSVLSLLGNFAKNKKWEILIVSVELNLATKTAHLHSLPLDHI